MGWWAIREAVQGGPRWCSGGAAEDQATAKTTRGSSQKVIFWDMVVPQGLPLANWLKDLCLKAVSIHSICWGFAGGIAELSFTFTFYLYLLPLPFTFTFTVLTVTGSFTS
jgi:hypothetical protein